MFGRVFVVGFCRLAMVYITEQRAIVRLNQRMACNHDAKREKHGKQNKIRKEKKKEEEEG